MNRFAFQRIQMTELPYDLLSTPGARGSLGTMGTTFISYPFILAHGTRNIGIKRWHVCCYIVQHDID